MHEIKESFDKILMDCISDMVFVMRIINDEEFIYEYINRAAMNRTGLTKSVIGKSIHEVNPHETAATLYEHYRKVVCNQVSLTYKSKYISRQGEICYSDTKLTPLIDQHKKCTHIIAIVKDITKKVNIARKLAEREEHFRIITEHADDLITLINHKGEIIYTSPSYQEILGFDHKEYLGKLFLHNVHPDDRVDVNKKVMQAIKYGKHFTVQFRQYNYKNQSIWSEAHGAPVFDTNKEFKHMVVVTRDIGKQKRYESQLEQFALHDPLTGLPNRRLFNKQLTRALKNFMEKGNGLAVIMLDIDNFKNINDEMGHDIGDEVIIEYGRRVRESIRKQDTIARLGGDEFVILLPGVFAVDSAILIAKTIQKAIQKSWNIKGNKPKVTTSMGIAMATAHNNTPLSILKDADIALYEAKNAGGNSYKIKQ